MAERRRMGETLTLDKFGELIDEFIENNELQILMTSPVGTQEVEFQDNHGCGDVLNFYFVLQAVITAGKNLKKGMDQIGGIEDEKLANQITDLMRAELLEAFKEETL